LPAPVDGLLPIPGADSSMSAMPYRDAAPPDGCPLTPGRRAPDTMRPDVFVDPRRRAGRALLRLPDKSGASSTGDRTLRGFGPEQQRPCLAVLARLDVTVLGGDAHVAHPPL